MYFDANGRPNPNGDYELIDGKQVLRDGRRVRFDLLHILDSAKLPRILFQDAQADSHAWAREIRDAALGKPRIQFERQRSAAGVAHMNDAGLVGLAAIRDAARIAAIHH